MKKTPTSLSERQRHVLVGLLLGDGHLETRNKGRTYRLKVEHGIKQKDYVQWLYEIYAEWVPGGVYVKKRKNGEVNVGFTTYSHGTFRFYGQQFYNQNGKKRVPKMIKKLLTPVGIAVWFMDDGSRKSARHLTYIIHTLGYPKNELEILQKALKDEFDVHTTLHKQKSLYWRLYIPSESAKRFNGLVKKYVKPIQSMKHKLVTHMPKE